MTPSDLRHRYVDANAIRIHLVEVPGEGRAPLLLLHGIWDRWESWEPVLGLFAEEYHVLVPELRGHGQTEHPAEGYHILDYVDDAVGLLDALGIERAAVVGHSLGAVVAAALAAEHSERVQAVVLEDPPVRMDADTAAMMGALLDIKRGSEEETYQAISEIYWQRGPAEWRRATEWLRGTADGPFVALMQPDETERELFPVLRRITCPALLAQADPLAGGVLSDEDAAEALAALPRGTFARFPETGHVIHRERPAEFGEVARAFLGAGRPG